MVDFSRDELLNELGQIFRGKLVPNRDGGLVDPQSIHAQLIEIAKTVFLLNKGALFYLARIVRNSALLVVRQEVLIIEDMLLALDDLANAPRNEAGLIGEVGPSDLANAQTALLSLEFANDIEGRPELLRFQKIMDKFTGRFRQNVVDNQGRLILPRGEARAVLRDNLESLQTLHPRLLALITNIVKLVDEFNALNFPSEVSKTSLINIRARLAELQSIIQQSEDETLITNSRLIVLRSLASKVVVALLEQFEQFDLSAPILTSDNIGLAFDAQAVNPPFLARSTGSGTPAAVVTTPGPWLLDELDSGTLSFKIDGGSPVVVDLSVIQGPGLHGRNAAPFSDDQLYPQWPGPPNNFAPYLGGPNDPPPPPQEDFVPKPNLHLMVDKNEYEFQAINFGYTHFSTGAYVAPEDAPHGTPLDPQPPAPDNNPPPSDIADDVLSTTEPRVYPSPDGAIANVSGAPGDLISDYYNAVRMTPAVKLGFKHLGGIIFFKLGEVPPGTPEPAEVGAGFGGWNMDSDDQLEDPGEWENVEDRRWPYLFRPRTVFELTLLDTITVTHDAGNRYTATAGTFKDHWVGFYVRVGTSPTYERYEIIDVEPGGGAALIDTRDDAAGSAAGTVQVYGTRGDYTQLTFFPDLLADTDNVADLTGTLERGPFNIPTTVTVTLSPTTKTARIPSGDGVTIASTIAALKNPTNGDYDALDNKYQHASYHCIFKEQAGFNNKITIQSRTRYFPDDGHLLQISGAFFKTKMFLPAPGTGTGAATGNSGGDGSLIAGAVFPLMRFSSPTAAFVLVGDPVNPDSLFNYLQIASAGDSANDGTFLILNVVSTTTVDVLHVGQGTIPDANNGSIVWDELGKGAGHMNTLPGPNPMETIEDSGHEVFGFDLAQRVDNTLDPYLSVTELAELVNAAINSATTVAEIVETDVLVGTLNVLATTFDVEDPSVDFAALGAGFGYLIELQEGDNAGVYFVESATGGVLSLARNPEKSSDGFVGNETGIPYRLFVQQLVISSTNAENDSSVEILTAPSQFGLPTGIVHGTQPAIEAVNEDGDVLDLSGLSPGDADGDLVVESVASDGKSVNIVGGVPANTINLKFAFDGATVGALATMISELKTLRDRRTLLGLNNFNQNLDRLDAALSALVTPGQSFQSNQSQARKLLSDLLGLLTKNPPNEGQYSATIPDFEFAVEDSLNPYTAPRVPALDVLLDSLNEHGYDRALALLITGRLADFFDTTEATASYAGNLLEASRQVAADIPGPGPLQGAVDADMATAVSFETTVDADTDFSDTVNEPSEKQDSL